MKDARPDDIVAPRELIAIDDPVGLFEIVDQVAVGSYGSVYKVHIFQSYLSF